MNSIREDNVLRTLLERIQFFSKDMELKHHLLRSDLLDNRQENATKIVQKSLLMAFQKKPLPLLLKIFKNIFYLG